MPTEDWLSDVVKALDPWTPPTCRMCGDLIRDRLVALKHAARETDAAAPELVRWYCSEACQTLGQDKP